MKPRVHVGLTERVIKSRLSDFINEIDGCEIITWFDYDLVDRSRHTHGPTIPMGTSNASPLRSMHRHMPSHVHMSTWPCTAPPHVRTAPHQLCGSRANK